MRRWRRVSDLEFGRILDKARKTGRIFNGCTQVTLIKRYGQANIKHNGNGWLKLTSR